MRVNEINSISPEMPASYPDEGSDSEPRTKPQVPEDTHVTLSGQLALNGITAYFEVRNGQKVVYSLVEDATGHVLGEFSPTAGLGISAAIDEMLHRQSAADNSTRKGH